MLLELRFKGDAPPSFSGMAEILVEGQVTDEGNIETGLSWNYIFYRDGDKYSSGGVQVDKCSIK